MLRAAVHLQESDRPFAIDAKPGAPRLEISAGQNTRGWIAVLLAAEGVEVCIEGGP